MFALIDYVNFKGKSAREDPKTRLAFFRYSRKCCPKRTRWKFVRAAKKFGEQSQNAPPEKDCSKRLGGWKTRVT
jgi:hypothetical protein